MAELRADMVQSAIKFLSDPTVQESPLAKRIAFLESKGLTPQEIQAAMGGQSATAPAVPQRDHAVQARGPIGWRDAALGIVGVAGLTYAGYAAFVQHIVPYFDFPTAKELRKDAQLTTDSITSISTSMSHVEKSTDSITELIKQHSKDLAKSIDAISASVEALDRSDAAQKAQIVTLEQEISSIKNMVPKVLEKNRVAFDELVADVMQEIKSLKNLLARGRTKESAVIGVSGVGKASIPAWQLESASTAPPDVQSEEISAAETQVSQPTETPNDNTAQKLTGVEAEDSKFDKDDSDLYKESESKKKSKHRARSKSPFKAQK